MNGTKTERAEVTEKFIHKLKCKYPDKKIATNDSKVTLTNVSYDPTRELYESYNKIFAKHWKEETGQDVEVTQSHGGSGKQALEVFRITFANKEYNC